MLLDRGPDVDDDFWDGLEEALILADVGAPAAMHIVETMREEATRKALPDAYAVMDALADQIASEFTTEEINLFDENPVLVLFVGINGAGKTPPTVGPSLHEQHAKGRNVLLGSADTFPRRRDRAARGMGPPRRRGNRRARARRPGERVLRRDRARAEAKGSDLVLIDTAGRLHTSDDLMRELQKVVTVVRKRSKMPVKTVLVIDATTGQNGLSQARKFDEALDLDGLIVTKLDGTAKGGIALAVSHELGLPIAKIGVGEHLEDLQDFDARATSPPPLIGAEPEGDEDEPKRPQRKKAAEEAPAEEPETAPAEPEPAPEPLSCPEAEPAAPASPRPAEPSGKRLPKKPSPRRLRRKSPPRPKRPLGTKRPPTKRPKKSPEEVAASAACSSGAEGRNKHARQSFRSTSEHLRRPAQQGQVEDDINAAMREIRMALLEADVNYKVVKDFTKRTKERCLTADVLDSLTPAQNVVKVVLDELTHLLGDTDSKLVLSSRMPNVIMLVGLQGAGKTTAAAKLAYLLKSKDHSPLLVACDVYRPAAADQLETLGNEIGVRVYRSDSKDPVAIAKAGVQDAIDHLRDVVIIDTAGRLHVDDAMMDEAADIKGPP